MNAEQVQQQFNLLRHRYSLPASQFCVFPVLGSTNTKAWELIQHSLPVAIIACQQTAGKGQWGKAWVSETGGLYLSVATKWDVAIADSFHLVMATAVGIVNLLRHYGLPLEIKWSNDLILASRKLGGIKIETKIEGEKIKYAVVGIGINWSNQTPEIAINLQEDRKHSISSLTELAAIATAGILSGKQDYETQGIEPIYQQYQQLLNSIGRTVTIEGNQGVVTGVTSKGELEVSLTSPGATSRVYFFPGEISLGYS